MHFKSLSLQIIVIRFETIIELPSGRMVEFLGLFTIIVHSNILYNKL